MKITLLILILCLYSARLYSQALTPVVVASAGESSTVSGVELSYTIGESVISFTTKNSTEYSEGFWGTMVTKIVSTINKNTDNIRNEIIQVYPNPVSDKLHIQLPDATRYSTITVMDIAGKVVYNQKPDGELNTIDFKPYKTGVYLLVLQNRNGKTIYKIIKH